MRVIPMAMVLLIEWFRPSGRCSGGCLDWYSLVEILCCDFIALVVLSPLFLFVLDGMGSLTALVVIEIPALLAGNILCVITWTYGKRIRACCSWPNAFCGRCPRRISTGISFILTSCAHAVVLAMVLQLGASLLLLGGPTCFLAGGRKFILVAVEYLRKRFIGGATLQQPRVARSTRRRNHLKEQRTQNKNMRQVARRLRHVRE